MAELAGRALDAAVAEWIFKQAVVWVNDHRGVGHPYALASELNGADYIREYHKNMADTWQVAEWIREQGYHLEMSIDAESTTVEIWEDDKEHPSYWNIIVDADAPTAQEALCRAGLKLAERMEAG